ncbi:MAG: ferritin-like domain-containing protein [bacterium JZ-2024 1]
MAMGEKGKEITGELARKVQESLKAMFAYEWLELYYFLTSSWRMTGISGKRVAEFFRNEAMDELVSLEKIARRILELGGDLPLNFSEIVSIAERSYPQNIPARSDVVGFLRQILDMERKEIDFLQKHCTETFGKDDVSFALFSEMLRNEVEDEQKWTQLLKKEEE